MPLQLWKQLSLFVALGNFKHVLSTPSPGRLNSDLVILTDNDLYSYQTSRTAGAILLTAASDSSTTESSCQLLGEELWSPKQDFNSGLNNSLSYQAYLDPFLSTQSFWIAAGNGSCKTINANGKISVADCKSRHAGLCTQGAPISNATVMDTSPRFQVTVEAGKQLVTGYREFYSWKFLGVRFAPQPERYTYSKVFDGPGNTSALEPGPDCMQTPGEGSEDCLFLNIWTPFLPSGPKLSKDLKPVVVWLFGGGFIEGAGYSASTDGTNFASRGDVVVVAPNARVGNLGFLALDDGVTNGNYGIQDLITALEWVSKYIADFGGDPSRVTIFGQSSGAAAVRALLSSPKTKGLLVGAISDSDPVGFSLFDNYTHYSTIQTSYAKAGSLVVNQAGCFNASDILSCMRAVNATTLASLTTFVNSPVIDGTYITTPGLSLTKNTDLSSVSFLSGSQRDDLAVDPPYPANPNITLAFDDLDALLGLNLSPFAHSPLFPLPTGPNNTLDIFNLTSRIMTDGGMHCLDQSTAYSAAKNQIFNSVYNYRFNRTYLPAYTTKEICVPPVTPTHPYGDPNQEYYKCHAGELVYVFGNILRLLPDRDGLDTPFSQLILDYWSSFVRTGDPNPDLGYLKARGYWETIGQVEVSGKWEEVKEEKLVTKWLQWDGGKVVFDEGAQCSVLGLPLDYFESVGY